MKTREEQLAAGLAQLQNDMQYMTQHIDYIRNLVPVFDFGDMQESAEESDISYFELQTANPPEHITYAEHVTAPHQMPLFDFEPPVTIIFENITINGEVVDMSERDN